MHWDHGIVSRFGAIAVSGVLLALSNSAQAESAPVPKVAATPASRINELEKKLDQSLKLIGDLAARVKELESELAAQRSAGARAEQKAAQAEAAAKQAAEKSPAVETRVAQVESRMTMLDGTLTRQASNLPLRGFFDVNAFARNGNRSRGFGGGTLDFYLTPELGNGFKSLAELVVERSDDGGTAIDLERVQVGYAFSDAATLWIGRVHSPFGYWNTAFHHGQQIAPSIQRPRFIDFEDKGGIIPAHLVGLWLTGQVPAGAGKFSYDLIVANAPRLVDGVLDPNNFESTSRSWASLANAGYRFGGAASNLKVGAHFLGFRAEDDGVNPLLNRAARTQVKMAGVYAVFEGDRLNVIGETYHFRNRAAGGGTRHGSSMGFLHAGYDLGWLTPYARYERARIDQGDDYFAGQASGQSYRRGLIGLRFETTANSALKFEVNRTRMVDRETDRYSEIRTELSVRF
ncbi:MAG TPA: hypothetical protein VFV17_00040 [Usitatibacteraceae bacterium]|nr:hypothetical protein [Usitatibacteraceae bacterium]